MCFERGVGFCFSFALFGYSAVQTNLDDVTSPKNPSNMSGVLGLGLRIVGGSFWTLGGAK